MNGEESVAFFIATLLALMALFLAVDVGVAAASESRDLTGRQALLRIVLVSAAATAAARIFLAIF